MVLLNQSSLSAFLSDLPLKALIYCDTTMDYQDIHHYDDVRRVNFLIMNRMRMRSNVNILGANGFHHARHWLHMAGQV